MRRTGRLIRVGNSRAATIPTDIVKQWEKTQGRLIKDIALTLLDDRLFIEPINIDELISGSKRKPTH